MNLKEQFKMRVNGYISLTFCIFNGWYYLELSGSTSAELYLFLVDLQNCFIMYNWQERLVSSKAYFWNQRICWSNTRMTISNTMPLQKNVILQKYPLDIKKQMLTWLFLFVFKKPFQYFHIKKPQIKYSLRNNDSIFCLLTSFPQLQINILTSAAATPSYWVRASSVSPGHKSEPRSLSTVHPPYTTPLAFSTATPGNQFALAKCSFSS